MLQRCHPHTDRTVLEIRCQEIDVKAKTLICFLDTIFMTLFLISCEDTDVIHLSVSVSVNQFKMCKNKS